MTLKANYLKFIVHFWARKESEDGSKEYWAKRALTFNTFKHASNFAEEIMRYHAATPNTRDYRFEKNRILLGGAGMKKTITKLYCDRCGKEIEGKAKGYAYFRPYDKERPTTHFGGNVYVNLSYGKTAAHANDALELCEDCINSFESWLRINEKKPLVPLPWQ